jgi:hypothetical protein
MLRFLKNSVQFFVRRDRHSALAPTMQTISYGVNNLSRHTLEKSEYVSDIHRSLLDLKDEIIKTDEDGKWDKLVRLLPDIEQAGKAFYGATKIARAFADEVEESEKIFQVEVVDQVRQRLQDRFGHGLDIRFE